MTYRSNDEAVFAGMRVFVDLGGSYIVKDVFKMEGFPQRYFAFDYDNREHPCDSHLPFNTRCTSEAVIDFGTGRLHTGTGLLAGHRTIRNIETGNRAPRSTTQFKIKTGDDFHSGSRSPLNLYYGKSCVKEICQYEKVAEINAERRDQEYYSWMPDFDYNKDQLIMDFRSGDELIIAEMSFNACLKDQCKEFNLLDFGAKNETILPTFHFANEEHPCNNRQGYGNQTCIYDAVFDFETSTLDFEDTTFVGKTSSQL